ncbi:MAG: LysR family transcriptional regulator [Myxococcales bacterium]|nr:LysR family transcriptional regulator [Myxococcales bacterium]
MDGQPPVLDAEAIFVFVQVTRAGGFSSAARRLGRAQSAVSQAIRKLERALGQPLFVRAGRASVPTHAARTLLPHAERALAALAQARDAVAALGALRAGTLSLGASDTLACHFLPPALAEMRRRHPGVELSLDNRPSPAVAARVAEGVLDLGVVTLPLPPGLRFGGRPPEERLAFTPLAPFEEVVACPVDHPLAELQRIPLGRLAEHPLLLLDRATGARAHLDGAFAERGLSPTVAMESTSVEVLGRLVALGFGVSVLPAMALVADVRAGRLAVRPLVGLPRRPRRVVAAVTARDVPPSSAAAALLSILRRRPS